MTEETVDYIATDEPKESADIDVESLPEATFEDILAEYEQEEGEFVYAVGEGAKAKKYRAKRITNLSDKIAITESAEQFFERYERTRKTPVDKVPAAFQAWKPWTSRPMNKKAATMIMFITSLLVSPKLTQLQCLRLHAKGGNALMDIAGPLLGATEQSVAESEDAAVDDAKNA